MNDLATFIMKTIAITVYSTMHYTAALFTYLFYVARLDKVGEKINYKVAYWLQLLCQLALVFSLCLP